MSNLISARRYGMWLWRLIRRIFGFVNEPVRYTNGFADQTTLSDHFDFHVLQMNEFPDITTESEYLALADEFLGGPLDSGTTYQCQRRYKNGSLGDIVRYNRITQEFGILRTDNTIRTYFKPDPYEHNFPTNYDYFLWNCRRKMK